MENVEEETEAAVAREMSRDRGPLPEVIDLTEHKVEEDDEHRSAHYLVAMEERDAGREVLPPVHHPILIGNRPTLQTGSGEDRFSFLFSWKPAEAENDIGRWKWKPPMDDWLFIQPWNWSQNLEGLI